MSEAGTRTPQPPRLVGLYRDFYDDDGSAVGWTVVGWGLVFPDKSAVTVAVNGAMSATVWLSLDNALRVLDAQTCEVNPRPSAQWWRDQ